MLLLSEIVAVNNCKWFTNIPWQRLVWQYHVILYTSLFLAILQMQWTKSQEATCTLYPSATKGMSKATPQFSTGFLLSSSEIAARKDASKQVFSPYVWSKHNTVGNSGFDLVTTGVSVCQDSFRPFNILLTKQLPIKCTTKNEIMEVVDLPANTVLNYLPEPAKSPLFLLSEDTLSNSCSF